MLGMDDKDLNAHVSLKKLAPYKEDDGEKMVLKKMKKKKWLEKKSREDTENKTENSGWTRVVKTYFHTVQKRRMFENCVSKLGRKRSTKRIR